MLKILTLVGAAVSVASAAHNILDYGAKPNANDTETAFANAKSFYDAVVAANASSTDREVLVPSGNTFYMMPNYLKMIHELTITIDGTIYLSDDYINWPNRTGGRALDFFYIEDSRNLTFQGTGLVDGQGYWWWMREYLVLNPAGRPNLLDMERVQYVEISGIKWQNAPFYHLFLHDIDSFYIHDFEIYVDVFEQKKLAQKHGFFDYNLNIPTFPLNTDGIDPSGTNVYIRNVNITNFDDAVAVKPANGGHSIATCAANILVEDCHVTYGVGMTIGSVPPHDKHACVANVTFRNIHFTTPIKAVYVKSNPGRSGDGIIENILYENLTMTNPIWWAIYIGPQQQKQPDGGGPGCMLYPIIKECETQPRITMRNITLRNVYSTGGLLPPGIIRCNSTNPCTDFTFDNVQMYGWYDYLGLGYITEYALGTSQYSFPDPTFGSNTNQTMIDAIVKAMSMMKDPMIDDSEIYYD